MNKPLTYIAVPYSHHDPKVVTERYDIATKVAGLLMAEGITAFSPISHCHHIAEETELPTDWSFWKKIDEDFLSVSNCFVVLCAEGWDDSVGVTAEIGIAKEMNIPIIYLFEDEFNSVSEGTIKSIKEEAQKYYEKA